MGRDVVVVGCGARTSVGTDAPMTVSSARAGLNRFEALGDVLDRDGEPVVVALPIDAIDAIDAGDRLAALAVPALRECLDGLAAGLLGARRGAVIVVTPAAREGLGDAPRALHRVVARSMEAAGLGGAAVEDVAWQPGGHAAGLLALEALHGRIAAGEIDVGVVVGCDSYLTRDALAWLDANDRLKTERARWGVVPGEAAAVVALAAADVATRAQERPRVARVASAREESFRGSGRVCVGIGLARALRAVLPEGEPAAERALCDLNGDRQRADELGFALTRLGSGRVDPGGLTTPADCWGDVGAASAPLLLVAAALWCDEAAGSGRAVRLVHCSSDDGACGAARIEVPVRARA